MAKYYVHCEKHGRLGNSSYSDPNLASQERKKHILDVPEPHGAVNVIEEYEVEKYGQIVKSLRQYKK